MDARQSLCAEHVHSLEVLFHRCLRGISRIGESDQVSNVEVVNLVLGEGFENAASQRILSSRLRQHMICLYIYGLIAVSGLKLCEFLLYLSENKAIQ